MDADASVFELVGNETRLAILRSLAEYRCRHPEEWPTFAEVRKAAGIDDTSNFNYHLDKLVGRFVQKEDGSYRLTYQGHFVVATLLAGAYETRDRREIVIESDCPFCAESQEGSFEDGTVRITCPNDHSFTQELPPGTAAERASDELLALTSLEMRRDAEFVTMGVCSTCYGPLETELTTAEGVEGVEKLYVGDCSRCGQRLGGPPAFLALTHPAVVAFYHDHGIDFSERPYWTIDFPENETTVVSESPTRVRVDVELDGDELRVTMDDSAGVVGTERL
ncbi:winged helix-turn-helix domain-containing protein [Halorussus halophilus]|uniref:winged helix-turn-helix domain-containing protein n=1 Tax=Halorussus halophilus TaxID=2650975 RepID=UPI0013011B0A|nr:helix-turn-helix domain-containing protein [Halorussus halophilus]